MIFFSIIIAVYNAEKHLRESIDSVVNQTCIDFELIVINDGSTDSSTNILEEYQRKYKEKIKIVHQENKGPLFARRVGFKHARGDYVIAIDSDDALKYNALQIIKSTIDQTECDMLFFDASCDKEFSSSYFDYHFSNLDVFQNREKVELYKLICNSSTFNTLWNKVVKKSIIDMDADYSDIEHVKNGEDLLQVLPLVTKAKKILYLDKKLYFYRDNINSISWTFSKEQYEYIKIVGQKVHYYLNKWNLEEQRKNVYYQNLRSIYRVVVKLGLADFSEIYSEGINYINYIATDDFFLEIYHKCDISTMKLKERIVLKALYRKKSTFLLILSVIYYRLRFVIMKNK